MPTQTGIKQLQTQLERNQRLRVRDALKESDVLALVPRLRCD